LKSCQLDTPLRIVQSEVYDSDIHDKMDLTSVSTTIIAVVVDVIIMMMMIIIIIVIVVVTIMLL